MAASWELDCRGASIEARTPVEMTVPVGQGRWMVVWTAVVAVRKRAGGQIRVDVFFV